MDAHVNNIGRPLQVRRHMNGLAGQILRVLAPTLLGLLALLPDAVRAEVLFPPQIETDLIGHYTDELPAESRVGQYRAPLASNKSYALEFRRKNNYQVVLLLAVVEGPSGSRDKILAILRLPQYGKDEAVRFICRLNGQTTEEKQDVFGIINWNTPAGMVPVRLGWHVNLETLQFEPVRVGTVMCEHSGVD